ncbi:MAG: lysophospholipid acyltransferase family protein, partial [Planctomycetota bacterium]
MNIQPYQTPPRMWDAKLKPWFVNLCGPLRKRLLKRTQRIERIETRGLEHVTDALAEGAGVLITPNHSSHADPPILVEVASRANTHLYFMAAWQVFAKTHRLRQLMFQMHGCFSVDREGTDMRAFRRAVEILQEQPQPLVIFGEGEVYHVNDRITPFRDGPAAIAITASKRAKRPIVCIPCAMKFEYTEDPTEDLLDLMSRLEERILWRPRPDLPLSERIYRFAAGLIGVKEVEYLGRTQDGDLPGRVKGLAEFVLARIEARHGITEPAGDLPDRVKACRREVIKELEHEEYSKLQQATMDLEDLFMVIQL